MPYWVSYALDFHPDGIEPHELERLDRGGSHAVLVASVIRGDDGGSSTAFLSVERDGSEMTDAELFKVWSMLTCRLAESTTLGPGKRALCAKVFATIRLAVLEGREKP